MDLFPGINLDPAMSVDFKRVCRAPAKTRGRQPDPQFIIKTVGTLGIRNVLHCLFIIDPSGCGETEVWRTRLGALKTTGKDGAWVQANPKAVTFDELSGIMSKTKECEDGLIAGIFRNRSKEMHDNKALTRGGRAHPFQPWHEDDP